MDKDIIAFLIVISLIFLIAFGLTIPVFGLDYFFYYGAWNYDPKICVNLPDHVDVKKYDIIRGLKQWETHLNLVTSSTKWNYDIMFTSYPCDINLGFDKYPVKKTAIGTTHCTVTFGRIQHCDITIFPTLLKSWEKQTVYTHELGHALGLSHREGPPNYLPYLVTQNDIMLSQSGPHQKLTHADLNAIRALYNDDGFGQPNTKDAGKYMVKHD